MNPIRQGTWQIHSVEVNAQPAIESDGFRILISSADEIKIEPIGIAFTVNQATARSAVLESQSQIFFADFFVRGNQLSLNLTRPSFSERISFQATYQAASSANVA